MLRDFLKVKTITKVKMLMSDEVNKRKKDTSKAKQIAKWDNFLTLSTA